MSTPRTWRGGERQVFSLIQELEKQSLSQWLICPVNSVLAQRLEETDFDRTHQHPKKRGGIDPFFALNLKKLCVEKEIDIVHCHDSHAHTAAILAVVIYRLKVKIVVSRRVDFPISSSMVSQFKYNHRFVQAIICVSDAIKEIVKSGVPQKSTKVHTVHSGVNPEKYENLEEVDLRREFQIRPDKQVIVNVAALADHKDYPTFLKTISKLKNRDLYAVIFGDGELKTELEELAGLLEISHKVKFAGFRTDVLPFLAKADCFLFPSKMEGLGTAVLDAFGCGVPVVTTRAGGITEMVEHEQNGLLADVGDYETLASHVEQVLDNQELRKRLTKNAKYTLSEFSVQHTASGTLKIYRNILS